MAIVDCGAMICHINDVKTMLYKPKSLIMQKPIQIQMEQQALKKFKNCLNINIYSYSKTSGGQSYYLHLNVVHFFNPSVH
jgi:hypothetical protein